MIWNFYAGAWRCNYRGAELIVTESGPTRYQWQVNVSGEVHVGQSGTLVVSKKRAEAVIRPPARSTAQHSRNRRERSRLNDILD